MTRMLVVWLLCALARTTLCADVPQGKVIWWGGMNIMDPCGPYSRQTNGVIESDEQIASNVVAVAGHSLQVVALRSDGTIFKVGRALGDVEPSTDVSNVRSITMAGDACWAIRSNGTVVRLGDRNTNNADAIARLTNITSITWTGWGSSYLALREDGKVMGLCLDTWYTNFAKLLGTNQPELVWAQGEILSNVTALTYMGYTPVVLKRDGSIVTLSYQTPGKRPVEPKVSVEGDTLIIDLGAEAGKIPFEYASVHPVMLGGASLTNVVSIAGAGTHALALRSDGVVFTVPDGFGSDSKVSASPFGVSNVIAIAADLGLKRDGSVVAWGGTAVPPGLSNVVQIAAAGNMAITTGAIPSSVFITPHGRLEEMARKADLVFKGQAISSEQIANAAFTVAHMKVIRTKFKVISVLQGDYTNGDVAFEHYAGWAEPVGWRGGSPPPYYQFEPGQSYIVIAAHLARKDHYYQPAPNTTNKPDEFREVADSSFQDNDGVVRTLDARPVETSSLREAAWNELNLLLNDRGLTNQLYAIHHLDSMSPLCNVRWGHSADFKRPKVLQILRRFLVSTNDKVAIAAINCFGVGHECATQLVAYVPDLIGVADNSAYSVQRRMAAIAALGGNGSPEITNSIPKWLSDPSEYIRARAVLLLTDLPREFSEALLRERATDPSPRVRARVADAIGTGKFERLLPTLETLFKDPVGVTTKPPSLSMDEYVSGLGPYGGSDANVHEAAGNALLKFDVDQVGGILKANLNDTRFRPDFLCEVAKKDTGPWIPQLVEMMETWRSNRITEARSNGFNPDLQLYVSSPYYQAWESIYNHLTNLPPVEFSNGKMSHYLDVLEETGQGSGISKPVMLYELYRRKGLNERATNFRGPMEKKFATWAIADSFKQVDARLTNSAGR